MKMRLVYIFIELSLKSHSEKCGYRQDFRVTKDALLHLTNATGINFTLQ